MDGGHLTAWVTPDAHIKVRYQSSDETRYLYANDVDIVAGEQHHFAFSFDGTHAVSYVDGVQRDAEDLSGNSTFELGMTGNTESLVFGASTTTRDSGQLNRLNDFFDGAIDEVVILDRVLYGVEAFQLAAGALNYVETNGTPVVEKAPPPPAIDLQMIGSDVDDVLDGDTGTDTIIGGPGNDTINGRGGNDLLSGDAGNDELHGGQGEHEIHGGSHNDFILGEAGDDLFFWRPRSR